MDARVCVWQITDDDNFPGIFDDVRFEILVSCGGMAYLKVFNVTNRVSFMMYPFYEQTRYLFKNEDLSEFLRTTSTRLI